jgi:hypothetical protein
MILRMTWTWRVVMVVLGQPLDHMENRPGLCRGQDGRKRRLGGRLTGGWQWPETIRLRQEVSRLRQEVSRLRQEVSRLREEAMLREQARLRVRVRVRGEDVRADVKEE